MAISFVPLLLYLLIMINYQDPCYPLISAPTHLRSSIWTSIPSNLRACTVIILHEPIIPTSKDLYFGTSLFLDLFLSQDKFLVGYRKNSSSILEDKEDVHKLRGSCIMTLVEVSSVRHNPIFLYEVVKGLKGVAKKDEDHFIFHSLSKEMIHDIFSSGRVASGVKNKVGVKINLRDGAVSWVTTCFFCNPGGNPALRYIQEDDKSKDGETTLFPDMLNNFYAKIFQISSPTLAKWLIDIYETSPGIYDKRRGIMNSGLEHIKYKYNFTGRYFPSVGGGGTGYRFKNGTWIGTVGDILSGRAEIAQCTGQIYSRNQIVGYSFPITYEWLTFTTGEPRRTYSWKSVYWPFQMQLWITVIASLLLVFLFLSSLLRLTGHAQNLGGTIDYLLRSFLEQDKTSLEDSPAGFPHSLRVFLAFWLIYSLVITTAYRSKLVSFLAFPTVEEPPRTFEALAKSTKFQIALQYLRGAAYSLMKTSPNPTFQNIFQRMSLEENDAKCFQRAIESPNFACISWDSVASFVYHKNLSDSNGQVPIIKSQDISTFIAVGLIFEKGAVYKKKFDQVLIRATDMGLMRKWIELDYELIRNERFQWEKETNRTKPNYTTYFTFNDALTMKNLLGTYFLLLFGLLGALFTFMGEIILYFIAPKMRSRSTQSTLERGVVILNNVADIHLLVQDSIRRKPTLFTIATEYIR